MARTIIKSLRVIASSRLVLSGAFLRQRTKEAIKCDCHDNNSKSGFKAISYLQSLDCFPDFTAKAARTDHGSDDRHGKRQHDCLVYALSLIHI